jgi:nucleotide-binding universal stress UspA family protein
MFDRIVVAVDGSACADRAVGVAAELAGAFGSEVVVVHVAPEIVGWGIAVEAETPDEASDVADRAVRELKDRGISARPELRRALRGLVAGEIADTAEAEDAGLIVMGSRGHGDFTGLLLGSVAHKVLHLSHVPVTVVK